MQTLAASAELQPEPARAERRLLLLEFVTHERWVFNGRYLPFIQGAAEQLGIPVRWLFFGRPFVVEKTGDTSVRQYMHLDDAELTTLRQHVGSLRPTHVALSHPVSPAVMRCLTDTNPDVQVLCLSDHPTADRSVSIYELVPRLMAAERQAAARPKSTKTSGAEIGLRQAQTDWLLSWLGETPATSPDFGKFIVGTFVPSYQATAGNAAARDYQPHLILMGGLSCDHRRKVTTNPHYRGLDLSECAHDFGCAYCTWYRGPTSELTVDPLRDAEQQLRRLVATAGPAGRFCGVLEVYDVRLFKHLERFTDLVFAVGLPPTTFCFEPRVDRFLQLAPVLERVLPRLAAAGHRLCLFRMGLETLVEEENFLYNKHVTLDQIDRATERLRALRSAFPGAFDHDPTWGYITCSPWTTLDHLETMVARAIERAFEPLGVWLYTPLLLYRGAPITLLAEREGGIVQPQFDDLSLLYEAVVNQVAIDCFLPWRFKDPRSGLAFALMVRFCAAALRDKYPDTVFAGDALYARLLGHEQALDGFLRPDLFAREAIAVVKAAAPPYALPELLDAALERYAALGPAVAAPAAPPPRVAESTAPENAALRAADDKIAFLLRALCERFPTEFAAVELRSVRTARGPDPLQLVVTVDDAPYELSLAGRAVAEKFFFQTEKFAVTHAAATPVGDERHARTLRKLIRGLERALAHYAPELLPS